MKSKKASEDKPILQLLYFASCPTVPRVRECLRQFQLRWQEILQDDLPLDHPYRCFSSPTLLEGENLLWGSRLKTGARACTLVASSSKSGLTDPRWDELREKLKGP